MDIQDFAVAYRKGLGRAWLHVESSQGNDQSIREILQQGCLEDFRYDGQCEVERSRWEYEIFQMTSDPSFYQKFILQELPKLQNPSSLDHALDLLECFARDGSSQAKSALYKWFANSELNESYVGGSQIISLDGLNGFFHVARQIGKRLTKNSLTWECEYILTSAIETYGEKTVLERLAGDSETDPHLKRYCDEVLPGYRESRKGTSEPKSKPQTRKERRQKLDLTFEQVLLKIENAEYQYPSRYMRFGQLASDVEIDILLPRFKAETRSAQLVRYAWFFRKYGWNKDDQLPEKVLSILGPLLKSDSKEVVNAVAQTLSSQDDPRVREAGLHFLKDPKFQDSSIPFALLESSVEQDDAPALSVFLNNLPTFISDSEKHSLILRTLQITDYLETDSTTIDLLVQSYLLTPCSHCRAAIYERLQAAKAVPAAIAQEHRHDCTKFFR